MRRMGRGIFGLDGLFRLFSEAEATVVFFAMILLGIIIRIYYWWGLRRKRREGETSSRCDESFAAAEKAKDDTEEGAKLLDKAFSMIEKEEGAEPKDDSPPS